MLEAALWGFVGGAALLLGAAIGLITRPKKRTVAFVMAFGAGVLVSAVAFDLTQEALELGGADATTVGLVLGGLTFFAGDWLLDRRSGGDRREIEPGEADGGGKPIVLGALLDGIPESAAIGLTLLGGGSVSASFVVAVFISNLPESLAASTKLRDAGQSVLWIVGLWTAIALVSALAAALGYELLGGASPDLAAAVKAFAAGAILCMLADSMFPDAYRDADSNRAVGLLTVLGFALAALLAA